MKKIGEFTSTDEKTSLIIYEKETEEDKKYAIEIDGKLVFTVWKEALKSFCRHFLRQTV